MEAFDVHNLVVSTTILKIDQQDFIKSLMTMVNNL